MLRVARTAALIGGALGMVLATQLATIIDALKIFYSLLSATLFVPVAGALLSKRAGSREAIAAIVCGVVTLLAVQFGTNRKGWWDPSLWGLAASAIGFSVMLATRRRS
jgi:Na+/proline symporter